MIVISGQLDIAIEIQQLATEGKCQPWQMRGQQQLSNVSSTCGSPTASKVRVAKHSGLMCLIRRYFCLSHTYTGTPKELSLWNSIPSSSSSLCRSYDVSHLSMKPRRDRLPKRILCYFSVLVCNVIETQSQGHQVRRQSS